MLDVVSGDDAPPEPVKLVKLVSLPLLTGKGAKGSA